MVLVHSLNNVGNKFHLSPAVFAFVRCLAGTHTFSTQEFSIIACGVFVGLQRSRTDLKTGLLVGTGTGIGIFGILKIVFKGYIHGERCFKGACDEHDCYDFPTSSSQLSVQCIWSVFFFSVQHLR